MNQTKITNEEIDRATNRFNQILDEWSTKIAEWVRDGTIDDSMISRYKSGNGFIRISKQFHKLANLIGFDVDEIRYSENFDVPVCDKINYEHIYKMLGEMEASHFHMKHLDALIRASHRDFLDTKLDIKDETDGI